MNLSPLLNVALTRPLSEAEARGAANALMGGDVPASQVGGLLSILRLRGEAGDEILGFARALRERASSFPLEGHDLIDTCGTGGDGLSTINVSTLSGLVAAACGARVAKHGNRAVSSRCGSADLLEQLGVRVDGTPSFTARCIEGSGFGFLFAPHYHSTLKHLGPIRKELGFRSIFNLVGPLANPALVKRQVIGVPSPSHLRPMAEALSALGVERAFVVHGADGSDEVSLVGKTDAIEIGCLGLRELTIHPEDAGLEVCRPEDLRGGDAACNADISLRVLNGERGPAHDFVVLNAGLALVVADRAGSLKEGATIASEALVSLRARAVLETLQRLAREAA